jgi:ABC-2 type transport system permease protein
MIRIHLLEAKYEFLKLLRLPAYSLPTICFPLLFYIFFGVGLGAQNAGGISLAQYMIATYGAFGVIGASLFAFGVGIAIERGQGWLQVKRTTPMPFSALITAKVALAMLFSAIIVIALMLLGIAIGHVHISLGTAAALFGVLVAGSLTFSALGFAVGCFAGPNSAAPIVNLIYLPMSFLSGLWVPIWAMPRILQKLAVVFPPFHFSQLALRIVGAGRSGSPLVHALALIGFTILFIALAWWGWRRDEGKMYG